MQKDGLKEEESKEIELDYETNGGFASMYTPKQGPTLVKTSDIKRKKLFFDEEDGVGLTSAKDFQAKNCSEFEFKTSCLNRFVKSLQTMEQNHEKRKKFLENKL